METGPVQEYPPLRGRRGALDRFQYLLVAVGILVFFTLGWRGRLPVTIVGGDELYYVSLSRSLEAGTYRELYSASAPRHVKYPPGYPALLAGIRKLGGESHDLVRAVNLAFVAGAILGSFLIVRKVAGVGPALAVFTLLAINPSLLRVGAAMMSEAPYLGFTGAALAASALAPPASSRTAYLAVALALAAFLVRAAGLTLLLAIGFWLAQRGRRRELLAYAVACLIVVGGWFAYTRLVPQDAAGLSYRSDLAGYDASVSPEAPSRLELAYQQAVGYATDGIPTAMALATIPGTKIDNILWLAALAVLACVGIVRIWQTAPAVAWYLVVSALLLVTWPWRMDRLLLPVFPFVLAAMLTGAHHLTRALGPRTRTVLVGSLAVLMGIGAVRGAAALVARGQTCDRSRPYESPGCYDDQSRSMAAAAHYLRSTASEGAVVLTISGAAVNYLSGLPTEPVQLVRRFPRGEAGPGLRASGIRYILVTGQRAIERGWFGKILLASCHGLRVEARFPPEALVLRPEPPRGPAEDSCGPLTDLVNSPGGEGGLAMTPGFPKLALTR